jgi:hypothetical protein
MTSLYISPTPGENYPIRAKVISRPAGLSPTQATSWLGRHMSDVLLQACLIEAHQFLKNKERMEEAATLYTSLLPQSRSELGKLKRRTYAGLGTAPTPPDNPAGG